MCCTARRNVRDMTSIDVIRATGPLHAAAESVGRKRPQQLLAHCPHPLQPLASTPPPSPPPRTGDRAAVMHKLAAIEMRTSSHYSFFQLWPSLFHSCTRPPQRVHSAATKQFTTKQTHCIHTHTAPPGPLLRRGRVRLVWDEPSPCQIGAMRRTRSSCPS